jgi:hypothetical protein
MCPLVGLVHVQVYLAYVGNRIASVCFRMLCYVCGKHECLYDGLCIIKTQDMSENRHIVSKSNKTTVRHINRKDGEKDGEQLKRSSGQADEGALRSYRTAVSEWTANAWVPDNHEDP